MSKVLDSLPSGIALKAPETASKPLAGRANGQSKGPTPRGLDRLKRRPGGWINSKEGSDWLIRRCDQFGIASSRYFKKNAICPRPTKDK